MILSLSLIVQLFWYLIVQQVGSMQAYLISLRSVENLAVLHSCCYLLFPETKSKRVLFLYLLNSRDYITSLKQKSLTTKGKPFAIRLISHSHVSKSDGSVTNANRMFQKSQLKTKR